MGLDFTSTCGFSPNSCRTRRPRSCSLGVRLEPGFVGAWHRWVLRSGVEVTQQGLVGDGCMDVCIDDMSDMYECIYIYIYMFRHIFISVEACPDSYLRTGTKIRICGRGRKTEYSDAYTKPCNETIQSNIANTGSHFQLYV